MTRIVRHLMIVLCALLLATGSVMVAAAPLADAHCAHDHASMATAVADHAHKHQKGSCLTCCIAACTADAALAGPTGFNVVQFLIAPVQYWEISKDLAGRSLLPDPLPPRSRA